MNRTSTSSAETLRQRCDAILAEEAILREGGGKVGLERQRKLGRLPARERIAHLLDEQRVCFRQLSLEAGEAAVTQDRARRLIEARIEALEAKE